MDDRAQIAAMALQGIVSSTDEDGLPLAGPNFAAARAVEYADALLEAFHLSSKTPPPARTKEPPSPPTDPGESEAGEPEGAASPQAEEAINDAAVQEAAVSPVVVTVGKPTSPVSVFDCEARFEHDPVCPGPAVFDPVSKGRFCGVHAQIPEGHRREMHRLHGHWNRPLAPVARLAG